MTATAFKKGLDRTLKTKGFLSCGKCLKRSDPGVTTVISFEKGFGQQWFVNVGFWLGAYGDIVPERVQKTHLYFRLERLFPEFRETILMAGAMGDAAQPSAYETLIQLISDQVDLSLHQLGTEAGLRAAMKNNLMQKGLVTKEAREFLGDRAK